MNLAYVLIGVKPFPWVPRLKGTEVEIVQWAHDGQMAHYLV